MIRIKYFMESSILQDIQTNILEAIHISGREGYIYFIQTFKIQQIICIYTSNWSQTQQI